MPGNDTFRATFLQTRVRSKLRFCHPNCYPAAIGTPGFGENTMAAVILQPSTFMAFSGFLRWKDAARIAERAGAS